MRHSELVAFFKHPPPSRDSVAELIGLHHRSTVTYATHFLEEIVRHVRNDGLRNSLESALDKYLSGYHQIKYTCRLDEIAEPQKTQVERLLNVALQRDFELGKPIVDLLMQLQTESPVEYFSTLTELHDDFLRETKDPMPRRVVGYGTI